MGSDIQKADRASRVRSQFMVLMAALLLIQAAFGFGGDASSMTPWFRHALWAAMILLWLVVLATGGWLRLDRRVRSMMNDEFTLASRSRALQAGFWVAVATGLALYFTSLEWTLDVREAIRILVDVSIAAALLRFAWLELRAG